MWFVLAWAGQRQTFAYKVQERAEVLQEFFSMAPDKPEKALFSAQVRLNITTAIHLLQRPGLFPTSSAALGYLAAPWRQHQAANNRTIQCLAHAAPCSCPLPVHRKARPSPCQGSLQAPLSMAAATGEQACNSQVTWILS